MPARAFATVRSSSDLARGEILADADRGDQRERNEHVGLDIERRHKADHRLENNWDAAQDDRHPGDVERKGLHLQKAQYQRCAGDAEKYDVALRAAQLEQPFQLFNQSFHVALLYTLWGMGILYP